ncbi:Protein of unknown function [Gryllus bimaculatus]|nr:Protein of unknown function [Gryllus bimaculatus]
MVDYDSRAVVEAHCCYGAAAVVGSAPGGGRRKRAWARRAAQRSAAWRACLAAAPATSRRHGRGRRRRLLLAAVLVALLLLPGVAVLLCLDLWRLCRRDPDGRDASSANGRHSVLVGNASFVWKKGPDKKPPRPLDATLVSTTVDDPPEATEEPYYAVPFHRVVPVHGGPTSQQPAPLPPPRRRQARVT